jgi:hypothetical protein
MLSTLPDSGRLTSAIQSATGEPGAMETLPIDRLGRNATWPGHSAYSGEGNLLRRGNPLETPPVPAQHAWNITCAPAATTFLRTEVPTRLGCPLDASSDDEKFKVGHGVSQHAFDGLSNVWLPVANRQHDAELHRSDPGIGLRGYSSVRLRSAATSRLHQRGERALNGSTSGSPSVHSIPALHGMAAATNASSVINPDETRQDSSPS